MEITLIIIISTNLSYIIYDNLIDENIKKKKIKVHRLITYILLIIVKISLHRLHQMGWSIILQEVWCFMYFLRF